MTDYNLSIRLSLKDAETVKRALESLGKEGHTALVRIEKATQPVSSGLKAVNAVSEELNNGLTSLSGRAGALGNVLVALGPAGLAAAAAIGAVAAAATLGIRAFLEAEESGVRLEAVLKATGNAAGVSRSQIKEFAEEFERSTKFSAEQIADASSVMLTFKTITGDTFFEAQRRAADLAATLKSDLSGAALQLGKALENPTEGITALKRAGVSFTEEQKKLIQSLVESGDLLGAQQVILKSLAGQSDNVAVKLGTQGLGGAIDLAGDKIGDFSKAVGGLIASGGALESIIRNIGDGFDYVGNKIQNAADWINVFSGNLAKVNNSGLERQLANIKKQLAEADKLIADIESGKQKPILGFIGAGPGSIDLHKQIREDLLKKEEQIEEQLERNNNVTRQGTVANTEHASSIHGIIDNLSKEGELLKLSSRDREIAEKTRKVIDDARKEGIVISKEEEAQIRKSVAANVDLANSSKKVEQERKKNHQAIQDYIKELNTETGLVSLNNREREIQEALLKAENIAKREHISLTERDIEAIRKAAAAKYDATEAAKKLADAEEKAARQREEQLKKAQEDFERPFIQAGENIQEAFGDAFSNMLINGVDSTKDLAEQMKNIMLKMVGEIAAAMIFRPIIQPVIASAIGNFGGTGTSSAAGGGVGNYSNLLGMLGKGGSFAGIGSQVNSFGASYLGLSSGGAPVGGMIGPTLPGGVAGGSTLMGLLGGAAGGLAIGSMNLFGGNKTGSTIGGTVGGLGGSVAGTALAGSAAAAFGATIGSVVPVVGTIIGGLIGSAIGGMFGGKPVSASEFVLNTATGESRIGIKNGDSKQSQGLIDSLSTVIGSLKAIGVKISDATLSGGFNSKHGNKILIDDGGPNVKRFDFDPGKQESITNTIATVAVELAKTGDNSGSLAIALQNIQTEGRKAEDILNDIQFASTFDDLGKIKEPVNAIEEALKALDQQFDDMRITAERLGLSVEKVTQAQKAATAAMQAEFSHSVSDEILQLIDPIAYQIQQENLRYQAQLKDAKALGISLDQVEQLHYLKMEQLANQAGYFQQEIAVNDNSIRRQQIDNQKEVIESLQEQAKQAESLAKRFSSVSANYEKTIRDLRFSGLSSLSPEQKLAEAQSRVNSLYSSALLGNPDAMEQLEDAVKVFLENDLSYNGTNAIYAADFERMQSILTEVKGVADRQVPIQERIYSNATQQLGNLQQINSNTSGVISAVGNVSNSISQLSQQLLSNYFNSTSAGNNIGAGLYSDASIAAVNKPLSYLDEKTDTGLTVRQVHIIARLIGYSGQFGLGGFDAFTRSNPDAQQQFNQLIVASGGKPRQFADGGITPRNQLFSVGERGMELMFSGSPHTVFSADQTRRLLDRPASNDALVSEMRGLRQELQSLIRITAMSGDMNAEGLSALESRLYAIESKARLEAAA